MSKNKKLNWTLAVWISFILGWLGIDRFLMGQVGAGILKLITLGGLGVWWLIDLILIMSSYKFKGIEWQLPENKRVHIAVICGLLVLGLILNSFGGETSEDDSKLQDAESDNAEVLEQKNNDSGNNISSKIRNKTEADKELSKEEKIKNDIKDILGSSNRDVQKVRQISVKKRMDNKSLVEVRYNADDNWGNDEIKFGIWIDAQEIFEKVYTDYSDIGRVAVFAYFPLQDKYGNSEDELVMKIMLDDETASKINWENFLTDNMPQVADNYYIHSALNE